MVDIRSDKFPRAGQTFTTAQVCAMAANGILRDSPFFNVQIDGVWQVVQTSHCLYADLIRLPGWRDATWRFIRETHEWIPIFHLASGDVLAMVDHETDLGVLAKLGDLWVTPKGLPRKQWATPL